MRTVTNGKFVVGVIVGIALVYAYSHYRMRKAKG